MATRRAPRKSPSTTTRKSSETQTEKPQSDSQASEQESSEISTEESTSSSSDDNDALFDEADEKAAQGAQEPDEGDDESEDEDEAPEDAEAAPVADKSDGKVVTFDVDFPDLSNYSFKGVISGNTITVTEDAFREFRLPGSKSKGKVLAHHRGQLLPLSRFERFTKNGK